MYLRTFRICASKSMNSTLLVSYCTWISMMSRLKKTKVKLDVLTVLDMLLMVEKGIRGGMCHAINRYVKANIKYMKDYNKNNELSYLKSWDVDNLYG